MGLQAKKRVNAGGEGRIGRGEGEMIQKSSGDDDDGGRHDEGDKEER